MKDENAMKLIFPKSILNGQPPTKENIAMALACAVDDILGTDVNASVEHFYDNPELIRKYAVTWDDLIKNELLEQCHAMSRMLAELPGNKALDAELTHWMAVAARDADDDWHIESNYVVLFHEMTRNEDGTTEVETLYMRTRLDNKAYRKVYEHPEDYLLVVCNIS